ncbi:MAG: type II toxin-antitoxin system Phd/YefM family antitoxin [Clostridia bacterium]|nr:type II toxin-antitoxin system Phd/YefM family antitoxin [Clostridia bacterium]
MDTMSIVGMMNAMVPITRFNKGEASKIFDEVEANGMKIVVKNNKPACVLLSPAQYENLMEMLSDAILLAEAEKRMAANDDSENISHEDLLAELGITEEELADVDVEIE